MWPPVAAPLAHRRQRLPYRRNSVQARWRICFDQERIAQLQRETEQVSALLAQVFVDDKPAEPDEVVVEETVEDTSSICGLDADHSAFLRVLVSRTEWARDELEAVASDMELMLDGALEQINDMAFEHFDMPVTEGKTLRNQP